MNANVWTARKWASNTSESFKHVLRQNLENCLHGRDCVLIEEFVDYHNQKNLRSGYPRLDTLGLEPWDFFEQLRDVCQVNPQRTHLYPIRNHMSTPFYVRYDPTPPEPSLSNPPLENQIPGKSISSSPAAIKRSPGPASSRPSTLNEDVSPKTLTIVQVQQILVAFTHGLGNKTLPWTEYIEKLEIFDPVASRRFRVIRATDARQIDFIKNQVSGIKNSIKVQVCDEETTVSISRCSCCGNRSQVPIPPAPSSSKTHEEAFSSGIARFKEIEMPLNDWLEVGVIDVDPLPLKLRITFCLKNHREFEDLHDQLRAAYQNNSLTINDLTVGSACAVPYESTKDYHRCIIKDVSNPSLPVVLYVDLGVELGVARGCIRKLHERFHKCPTFSLTGEVSNSPLFEKRICLASKLRKMERVLLKAEKYDEKKARYIVVLDTDSGIASDASV